MKQGWEVGGGRVRGVWGSTSRQVTHLFWIVWSGPAWQNSSGVEGRTQPQGRGLAEMVWLREGVQNPGRGAVPLVGSSLTHSGVFCASVADIHWDWGWVPSGSRAGDELS